MQHTGNSRPDVPFSCHALAWRMIGSVSVRHVIRPPPFCSESFVFEREANLFLSAKALGDEKQLVECVASTFRNFFIIQKNVY
jgi:hypothetical protein